MADVARRGGWLVALALAVTAAFAADLAAGSVAIPLGDVVRVLAGGEGADPSTAVIVRELRLPKALTATLAGAALAVAGLLMQTLFRNPLAGPYVLGLSAGASLGVAAVVLGVGAGGAHLLGAMGLLGDAGLIVAASLGAGLVLGLVLLAARRVSTLTLLILGVLFGYAVSALVTVLMHFSIAERIQAYVQWTFGSFGAVSWPQLRPLAAAVAFGLFLAFVCAKAANALLLGGDYAASMGLAVRRARLGILIATALLAGAVTAFCGPIGFLGVAVPHLARALLKTGDHRLLLPAAALAGALVALLADVVAQLPGSEKVLPLNAVTALIGAPVIAWIILRRRGLEASFG